MPVRTQKQKKITTGLKIEVITFITPDLSKILRFPIIGNKAQNVEIEDADIFDI